MNDAIERIWHRLMLMIGRGRITFVDDSQQVQMLQVKLGQSETKDNTPRLGEYGFQSNPPPGSDGVALFIAGERTNGVVIATGSQQYRMRSLATGEVSISDDKGQHVYLSAAGIRIDGGGLPIEIKNAPSLLIDVPAVHMTGTLHVDGATTIDANTTVNATMLVNGQTVMNGPISQTAGGAGGTAASLIGPLTVAGDVLAEGTSLHGHMHDGGSIGSGTTTAPV